MSQTILEKLWKLRNDPFFPAVNAKGTKLRAEAYRRSLDPLLDRGVLPLYFDIYDWEYSSLVRGISDTQGLTIFPDGRTQPADAAFMFVLSGCRESGVDSLANLILLKISDVSEANVAPLIVEVELSGREKSRNVATVAKLLLDTLRNEGDDPPGLAGAVRKMQASWDREYGLQGSGPDAIYSDAFQTFRNQLRNVLTRPLVLKITSGGDNDSWLRIYEAVRRICSHVIVMTGDLAYARTAYKAMSTASQNIAWIHAGLLDGSKAQRFVAQRLSAERLDGADVPPSRPLLPFLVSAIETLYEKGSTESTTDRIEHPVGWLRRMLYRALKDRLDELGSSGAPEGALDVENALIGPEDIRRATSRVINRKLTP
jgi:hypothetical protein